ncbi:50S ribosomal protein L17 [Candidatus Latescibacterota bacterium]
MRHAKTGRKLSRRKDHRIAMLANLASSLIKHGSIRTTDAKAKEVRPFVERMITFARRGDLHARRIVLSRLKDPLAVKKLFDEIGPKYSSRFGGYTRIIKLGFRLGDNSSMSLIELIEEEVEKKTSRKGKSKKVKEKPVKEEKVLKETPETVEAEPEEAVAIESTEESIEAADEKPEEISDQPEEEASEPDIIEAKPAEAVEEKAIEAEAQSEKAEAKSEEVSGIKAEEDSAPVEEDTQSDEPEKKDSDEEQSKENK